MKISDVACGAALLLLAVVVGIYAQTFSTIPGQHYGAGAFPTVIAVGLGAFSLALIARGLGEARAAGRRAPAIEFAEWARTKRTAVNFAAAILLVVAYVLFSERIGFIPISSAILILLFWRMRVRPLTAVIVGVAMSVVIHVAFVDFLRVPLPRGLLDRVLW